MVGALRRRVGVVDMELHVEYVVVAGVWEKFAFAHLPRYPLELHNGRLSEAPKLTCWIQIFRQLNSVTVPAFVSVPKNDEEDAKRGNQ